MNKKPKIGIQLYTLRKECADDFEGTLRKVAAMGYEGVELAGFFGWNAAALKNLLDELGLRIAASLVAMEEIIPSLDDHLELGCDFIVVPSVNPDYFRNGEQLDRLVEKLRTVSAACRAKGIKLGYHNHDFDVLPRIDGEPALFSLYSRMKSSELLAEPDVYWLRKGGVDEVETLRRYQGRILNAHLKDMTPDGRYAPVGGGILDMKEIIRTGIETGIEWFIVEQDQCYDRSPLECIEDSLGYIKRLELL